MDFSPNSYFNNFDREELIFSVWNFSAGNIFDRRSNGGALICALLKTDPQEAMFFSIQWSDSFPFFQIFIY